MSSLVVPPPLTVSDLSSRLADYPALPPEERAALARDVDAAGDAALAAALAEAQAFAALLDAAGPPAPDLAQHLTDERLGHATDPALAARIARDPVLRAEAARIGARLDAVAAASEDPVAQFERLSGHTLAPPRAARPRAADRAAAPVASSRVSRLRLVRGLAVAASVCLVAYAGLFAASGARLSEPARVADLDAALAYRAPTLRGGGDPGAPLAEAIGGLAAARRSTLGLFPRYDADGLDAAAGELARVAEAADAGSGVQQEALLTLARVRIHQGRYADAAAPLRRLVALGDYAAPEARRLLDYATAQASGEGG